MAGIAARARCQLRHLGLVPYKQAWDLQAELVRARKAGETNDQLLLLEHPHVYTLGRRGGLEHVLLGQDELARRGIELFEVDRGGDVTYHGPGQLVGYPIIDLRRWGVDAHRYVWGVEETIIRTLAEYGLEAQRAPGYTGVWLGEEKICAIGVRISGGVTSHGFALNVNTDLSYFAHIVPCGIVGRGVTSLARVLGHGVPLAQVADQVAAHFAAQFDLELVPNRDLKKE
ncbi:MAG: lipoyl(octanoyl) transferase LipB [Chloroflexota bacterium]